MALPTTRSYGRDYSLVGGEASTALGVTPRLDQPLRYRTAGELGQDPRRPDHQQEAHGPCQPLHQGPCMGYQDQRDIHDDTRQGGDDRADPCHRRRDRPAGDQGRGGRDRPRARKQAPHETNHIHSDLAERLFGPAPKEVAARRRRTVRVSRLLHLLRAHGLLAKIARSHRYRITAKGEALMGTALYVRYKAFPKELQDVPC